MCGISIAINTRKQSVSPEQIKAMNDKVSHRGPDDEGFFHGDGFAFGHRRLSILDLSSAGHQPMQRGKLWITYNGEVYNYIELRDELKSFGHTFKTGTDTEVILAAYAQWGTDAFARLNGMWAFAIYDAEKAEIVFCRDHFGIKPLYFTAMDQWFLAGSEVKQFTVFDDFRPKLNNAVAVNFLVHGWLNHSDQTFFEGVNELRPGHFLKYDLKKDTFSIRQWYDLGREAQPVADSFDVAVKKVRELFIDSVRLRMRSDVKVGACLSGGIDSSAIVSLIHKEKLANADFATVTSCYEDPQYDEQKYSDLVSAQTGFLAAKVFPNLNELLDSGDFDRMIYHQDQPFSGATNYSEFKVFETARKNAMIVMQDGQGSDEYLCGYGEFYITHIRELVRSLKLGRALSLIRAKAAHKNTSFTAELKSVMRNAYVYRLQRRVKQLGAGSAYPWLADRWKAIANESITSYDERDVRSLSITEIMKSSIPYQLHSEDRNSMLFSIESRLPFLDHRLVEYVIGLPSAYKISRGYTKYVLREALPELPEPIKHRKDKMGFVAPDRAWIRQNKDRVRAELQQLIESTDIFSDQLLQRFDRFIEGKLGYEPIYFRAMAFNRFCKVFNVSLN